MKRRGNGEGSVIRVSARNYKAVVVVGWKDDKHPIKRTKQGFRTAAEARAYIPLLKQQRADTRTLADYWKIYSTGEMLSIGDKAQYKYALSWSRLEQLADRDLHTLRIDDLNSACADLTYFPAKNMKDLLSHLYQLAMAEEYVSQNLALHMTLPQKGEEVPKTPFAKGEIALLWFAWEREHEQILGTILLMCYTGMMPIELLKLSVSNVNMDEQTIIGVGAKTQKRRTSPIIVPDIVMPVLTWLCDHADHGRFYTRSDKRYREDFKRCLARLGISTEHTPYDCRHTTATMYSTLLDPHTLTEVMRHTNLEMTQHYKHTQAADILHEINLGIKKDQGI